MGKKEPKLRRIRRPKGAPVKKKRAKVGAETAVAIREVPASRRLGLDDIPMLVSCAREGWSPEEIAASLQIDLGDVRMWSTTFAETRRIALPEKVPDNFSAIEKVREIAASSVVPSSVQLHACKLLLMQSDTKMRVDWSAVKIDDIPPEQRGYLAGMLVEHLEVEGVDREFLDAGQAERDLFMVVGVLVDDSIVAIDLLNKHRLHLDALRAEAQRRKTKRRLEAPTVRFAAEFGHRRSRNEEPIDVESTGGDE